MMMIIDVANKTLNVCHHVWITPIIKVMALVMAHGCDDDDDDDDDDGD